MLREEVLREWRSLSEIIKKKEKITEFVFDKINGEGVIPNLMGPYPIEIEEKLEEWTNLRYQNKIQDEKIKVAAKAEELESTAPLQFAYFNTANIFEKLAQGWWREKRYSETGPTIEEID